MPMYGTYRDVDTGIVHIIEIHAAGRGRETYVLHCAPGVGRTIKQRMSRPFRSRIREDIVVTCLWCITDSDRHANA